MAAAQALLHFFFFFLHFFFFFASCSPSPPSSADASAASSAFGGAGAGGVLDLRSPAATVRWRADSRAPLRAHGWSAMAAFCTVEAVFTVPCKLFQPPAIRNTP